MNRDWSPLGGARPKKVENEMGGRKTNPENKNAPNERALLAIKHTHSKHML